jgi:hypothetical protein
MAPVSEGESSGAGKKEDAELPSSPAEKEVHIEDALREVDAAERALDTLLKNGKPTDTPPTAPPRPAPNAEPASGCETACQALTSMQRAAAYVCKLAGESDSRCLTATGRVKAARQKIDRAACSCPEPVACTRSTLVF